MLEARLEGRQPVAVTDNATTLEQAVHGAAQKLVRLLDRLICDRQANPAMFRVTKVADSSHGDVGISARP